MFNFFIEYFEIQEKIYNLDKKIYYFVKYV